VIGFTRGSGGSRKPHRGEIRDWARRSAPGGLGFRVEGTVAGEKVTTTSILARDGDEVETLNWRYTLVGGEKR